jgi:hypothetical protein
VAFTIRAAGRQLLARRAALNPGDRPLSLVSCNEALHIKYRTVFRKYRTVFRHSRAAGIQWLRLQVPYGLPSFPRSGNPVASPSSTVRSSVIPAQRESSGLTFKYRMVFRHSRAAGIQWLNPKFRDVEDR